MKKASKKEMITNIYKEYGIEYDAENNKVFVPGFGWTFVPLVNGNEKIGVGVWHFSTLPGNKHYTLNINVIAGKLDKDNPIMIDIDGTCGLTCDGCYAMTNNYRYGTTLAYLAHRTILARKYIDFLERCINAQIKAENIKLCRIHASGDFFNIEYIEMWKRIAINNKACVFWSYTKNKDAESAFDAIPNCNIVASLIPNIGKNYGTCKYIMDAYAFLKSMGIPVYICRCGIDDKQHCINCTGCSKYKYVLFIEHSTSYKAEKDPLFPAIKALIESQNIEIAGKAA